MIISMTKAKFLFRDHEEQIQGARRLFILYRYSVAKNIVSFWEYCCFSNHVQKMAFIKKFFIGEASFINANIVFVRALHHQTYQVETAFFKKWH